MSRHFDVTLMLLSEEFVVDFTDILQGTLPHLQGSLDSLFRCGLCDIGDFLV